MFCKARLTSDLGISRVFTVDRRDFFVYRLSIGHEIKCFEVIG